MTNCVYEHTYEVPSWKRLIQMEKENVLSMFNVGLSNFLDTWIEECVESGFDGHDYLEYISKFRDFYKKNKMEII